MSLREKVFQAKVLQRLYPATLKTEEVLSTPVHLPKEAKSFKGVQLKPSIVTGHAAVPPVSGRKVYTVLLPPKDYLPPSGDGLESPTDIQPINNADEMPVELSGSEERSPAEDDDDDDPASKKRKRRRKRKAARLSERSLPTTTTSTSAAASDKAEDDEERNKGNAERSVCLGKNKRRKMKKKRRKEKLLALGLVPRSTALEFTYKQKEDEEDEEKKMEEVLDFLQSIRQLYLSDRSCTTSDPSGFLSSTDSLFTRLSGRTSPHSVLSMLFRLRALLRQREVKQLHTLLQEFSHTSTLPKDETDVIATLFNYWITEVLPMQTETMK